MSPIGRIFIVLNLALAGGFVYFSGVYLQRATDWKQKHDTLQADMQKQVDQLTGQLTAEQAQKRDSDRKLNASEQAKNALETQNQELRAENERYAKQLSTIQAEIQTQAANYSTISSSIDTSTQEYQRATQQALAALQERDEAVRAKEVAQADLRDSQDRVAALETSLAEQQVAIADLEQTIREKDVLLDIVRTRVPGVLELAQPKLLGTVQRVDADGKLVTILITSDDADAGAKPGYSFALYAGSTYKGEAVVTDVDGNFAFCRVTRTTGRPIMAGDQATTVTN